jgi:hypothetical protein
MTVHLIKLCVGCDTVEELAIWQAERLKRLKRARKTPELCHRTLQTPRRRDEVLDGGSLYWVIKGFVLVRQRVLDLRPDAKDDGTACCGIVLDKELVATRAHPRRAFQGWRYLEVTDAPRDGGVVDTAVEDMPRSMREELRELRLIDW